MASFLRRPLRYRYYNVTIILVVVNVLVWLLSLVARSVLYPFYLLPDAVLQAGAWWQVVTYMFIHANFQHILFNMLTLFVFGLPLEQKMGSNEFLLYYFVCGIGAGVGTVLIYSALGAGNVAVIGASGALFSLMIAFAALFPDARIYLLGFLPMRAPTAVALMAVLQVVMQLTLRGSGVAFLTHVAGILFGFLYVGVRYGISPVRVFSRRR
jgi:membrane associated rhomboid family serine protease